MSDLDVAIKMAVDAHAGQLDKGGQPYILHPLRVMLAQPNEDKNRIAAVLHDVVEDGYVCHSDILAFFGEEIHSAVFALTRQIGEDYFTYVSRAAANHIARQVKVADLLDNMDARRTIVGEGAENRLSKYRKAYAILKEAA